jgi:transitional endoplasmic reticulum ATPase
MDAIQKLENQIDDFVAVLYKAAHFLLCTLPLCGLVFQVVMGAWRGTHTSFAIQLGADFGAKGNAFPYLLGPLVYLTICHVGRLIAAVAMATPEKATREPAATSYFLLYCAWRTVLFYGIMIWLWAYTDKAATRGDYWTVGLFLAFAMLSAALALSKWVYGYKLDVSPTLARQRQALETSMEDSSNVQGAARMSSPSITFEDIFGNLETKRRLLAAGQAILQARNSNATPRNGILLHGAPGNGKTVFAEALAGELNLPFLQLTNSDVESMWVGQRTERVVSAFKQARALAPCLLFIDEFDSFVRSRDSLQKTYVKEDTDIVNALLTLIVDLRKTKVVLVAATNFIDTLDEAAIREGRFDFKVEITHPDQEARIGLLRKGLKTNTKNVKVDEEVLTNVASRWNGFSVKRILAVTEELPGYIADLKEKGKAPATLGFEDFMAALRRIQGRKGASPENVKSMSELILPTQTREALTMIAGRLKDPIRVERLGGTLPYGVLFHGPAGTGKTTAAKALAKEVGSAFLTATGTDLARDVKALEKLFAQANELRPAIIFIDEADDLLRSREYSNSTEATTKLLALMDGVTDRVRDIVWIAATNHPEQIDSALLRGGRFTEKVEFVLPTGNQLESHINTWLTTRKIGLSAGLSVGDIAGRFGTESIANTEAVLQYALNRAIAHTENDKIEITSEDLRAGHAVVLGGDH